jgi:hypothetical protein
LAPDPISLVSPQVVVVTGEEGEVNVVQMSVKLHWFDKATSRYPFYQLRILTEKSLRINFCIEIVDNFFMKKQNITS